MYLVDEVLVVVVPLLDLLIVPVLEVGLATVGVGLQPQALALVRLALQAPVSTQPPQLPTNQSEVSTAVVSTNHSSPGRPCPSCAPSTRGGCPAPASARGLRPARSLCTPRGLQIWKFMAGGYYLSHGSNLGLVCFIFIFGSPNIQINTLFLLALVSTKFIYK